MSCIAIHQFRKMNQRHTGLFQSNHMHCIVCPYSHLRIIQRYVKTVEIEELEVLCSLSDTDLPIEVLNLD